MDITVLEDDHEHIPNILEDLRHSLDIVESVRYKRHALRRRKYANTVTVKKFKIECKCICMSETS